VGSIRILNRSVDRAEALATRTGGEAGGLHGLAPALAEADLVVSSTGAAGVVIGTAVVREALRLNGRHSERPLFLLDLAVPRDIDPAVAGIEGVLLADIDDLREALGSRNAAAAGEVERVRGIVGEEVKRFATWRRAARLAPLIQALRAHGERIQEAELRKVSSRLAGLSDREREAVHAMAAGIVAKLLHDPIVRLKELSGPGGGDSYARVLAELFGIDAPGES
jgi:glutamyl-tRNA reductase